jgi:hypothetical protein
MDKNKLIIPKKMDSEDLIVTGEVKIKKEEFKQGSRYKLVQTNLSDSTENLFAVIHPVKNMM